MNGKFRILSLAILFLLTGCFANETEKQLVVAQADEQTLAAQLVETYGYTLMEDRGLISTYTLEQGLLSETQYQEKWAVQTTEPDLYFGKVINTYCFTVDNHPLEKEYHTDTEVCVMASDGKFIGGYSFMEKHDGGVYSLEGKTLEEATGLSYPDWSAKWQKKYGAG